MMFNVSLLDPDVWNLIFAVAGAIVGWLLRNRQSPSAPPELLSLLDALLNQKKQQDAQAALADLLASLRPPTQPPPRT